MHSIPTHGEVQAYLERVDASGVMGRSSRRVELLEHLLTCEIEGEGDKLKAYSIGLDVFEREASFDPASDSIVRVEMGRLRAAIATFEDSEYADTDLMVTIPVGTYRPNISRRSPSIPPPSPVMTEADPTRRFGSALLPGLVAVVIGVMALFWWQGWGGTPAGETFPLSVTIEDFSGDEDLGQIAAAALRRQLAQNKSITVIDPDAQSENATPAHFIVSGSVLDSGGGHEIAADLTDTAHGKLIWSASVDVPDAPGIAEAVATGLGNELRVRLFGTSKEHLMGSDPDDLSPEELFIMATWVPGPAVNAADWEEERIALATLAVEKDPNFGMAHSVLADKLAYMANFYARFNTPDHLAKAEYHAQRALELAPQNADAVFNVAQSQWHRGQLDQAKLTMRRVLEIDSGHDMARFLNLVMPYTCAAPPDQIVSEATQFDADLSQDNPIRWLTLTWIGWLNANQQNYQAAIVDEERAALIFEVPYSFMRHAMVLNRLDRLPEAKTLIERQQRNWPEIDPDFYASTTIARFCADQPDAKPITDDYKALAQALR